MEDTLWWKTNFDGRQFLMESDLWWKTTFDGRWPLLEDNLWWKISFDQGWHLMEDNLWWKKDDLWWKPSFNWKQSENEYHFQRAAPYTTVAINFYSALFRLTYKWKGEGNRFLAARSCLQLILTPFWTCGTLVEQFIVKGVHQWSCKKNWVYPNF